MTGVLVKEWKGKSETRRHREEVHIKIEVETEVILPQTKESRKSAEVGRGKEV